MGKIKLFCIPHAGGSAIVYHKWKKYLNSNIELVPVELAGRGRRISENLYDDLNQAIEDVAKFIENNIDENDYMIYGHSMGCTIAYEACCKIIEDGKKKPLHIFLSGRECPDAPLREPQIHGLDDESFQKAILALGGTPEEVFEMKELREVFMPIMRSDYKNIETYEYQHKGTILPVDMSVLNGRDDDLSEEEINGWKEYTNQSFYRHDFDGGHFFLHENCEKVVKVINESV